MLDETPLVPLAIGESRTLSHIHRLQSGERQLEISKG
jgi:hypothetical protein